MNVKNMAPDSFEKIMEKIEALVAKLEKGDASLEENFSAYAQGVELMRLAQQTLDEMDRKLEKLMDNGKIETLELEETGRETS